jgi:hypothetical protein
VHEADPCFEGTVARADPGGPVQARYSAVVTQNFGLGFKVCRDAPAQGEAEARAAHAATSEPLPCVEPWTVTVHGDAQRDIGRLRNAVAQACGLRDEGASFVVLFDADGRVSDVQGTVRPDGVPAVVRECVRRATEEMPLACLAGMAVCPEWQRQD